MNNEHEDNQEIHPKINFKRMSCTNEIDFEEDMDYETLPLKMMTLIDHENEQILTHKEVIVVVNLGRIEEKKEVKF